MTKEHKLKLVKLLYDTLADKNQCVKFLCCLTSRLYFSKKIDLKDRSYLINCIRANRPKRLQDWEIAYWTGNKTTQRKRFLTKLRKKIEKGEA